MYSCRMIAGFIKLLNDNDESIRGMSTFEVSTADSNCYLLPQFDLFCKYLEPRLKKDMYLKFLLYWIFREPTYQNEEELLDTVRILSNHFYPLSNFQASGGDLNS